jgi:exosortase/archaeosortase family protein
MILVVRRPWLDCGLILVSAIPIAVFSNILRIAATGVLYNAAGKEMGDRIFHDFAGWMMMPLALCLLLLELKILDWVFLEDLGQASREDVIRMGVKPAHLFMTSFEGPGSTNKPAVLSPPAPRPPRGQGR